MDESTKLALLRVMSEKGASDLFITAGAPISIKINNVVAPLNTQILKPEHTAELCRMFVSADEWQRFTVKHEFNGSYLIPEYGNFRLNFLHQRGSVSAVIRHIKSTIPEFRTLNLPPALLDLVMAKRGLILVVGSTGSGKSTTLASMIDHRNAELSGHILTIEDPVEFMFAHKRCVVNQREVGFDTDGYNEALTNALRQAPDLLLIGEVRDRATMQHALTHALTGNLCLTTLHATNTYHALSRILNMYPQEARSGLLADLSYGLKAIIGQRLVVTKDNKMQPAVEILVNTKLISEIIASGELHLSKRCSSCFSPASSATKPR